MFTGIIQSVGTVRSIQPGSPATRLTLDCPKLARPIALGASVCVSGVCLTVTAADEQSLSFDVVPETLARATLGQLRPGDRVNLERSLRAGDGMDGHTVQGHVDGTATVSEIARDEQGHVYTFEPGPDLMKFMIPKGSVAIDGVSLTIADTGHDYFSVALIPTTLAETTLGSLKRGDRVNIETDIIARTIITTLERWRGAGGSSSSLSLESLRTNGWA